MTCHLLQAVDSRPEMWPGLQLPPCALQVPSTAAVGEPPAVPVGLSSASFAIGDLTQPHLQKNHLMTNAERRTSRKIRIATAQTGTAH